MTDMSGYLFGANSQMAAAAAAATTAVTMAATATVAAAVATAAAAIAATIAAAIAEQWLSQSRRLKTRSREPEYFYNRHTVHCEPEPEPDLH